MSKHQNWHPRDYQSMDDIRADLDRMQAAHDAGTLRTTGNWEAGQIFDHCSKPMRLAFDGFFDDQGKQINMAFPLRVMGNLIFKPMLGRSHMKPGIKLPASASSMLPTEGFGFEDGMNALRTQLARLENGEKMTHRSPLLGKMSHEQWMLLHLDHMRLHFGFIQYPGVTE